MSAVGDAVCWVHTFHLNQSGYNPSNHSFSVCLLNMILVAGNTAMNKTDTNNDPDPYAGGGIE